MRDNIVAQKVSPSMVFPFPSQISTHHTSLALQAIDDAGLQAPPPRDLENIVRNGYFLAVLLWNAALLIPSPTELDEAFQDFVVRCINKAPGLSDVLS